jgi:1,4-dihydroxy-2-naphthoate octaprenyltransferase
MRMPDLQKLLGPMRLPFLILTPACYSLGLAAAVWTSGGVEPSHALLAFLGAIAAHISVNALNEYFDFKSGLDATTRRTPFSGGSGTLQENPELSPQALATGLIAMAITALIGLYFLSLRGSSLLPLGLLGLLVILAYTPMLTHNPILCLITPGTGFGLLMVMGTNFALTGEYTWTAFIASLVPFFLVNNLLLLNQFPDVEADQAVGRRHLPIIIGRKASSVIYGIFLLGAYMAIVMGVWLEYLPITSLLGLGTLLLAVPALRGAIRYAEDIPNLIPSLGQNVLINILTPVLVAIGLFVG